MESSYLVVGLGNPGPKYAKNRHNFGFMVADELADRSLFPSWREKFSGLFAKVQLGDFSFTLLKPMTFMNLSGKSVSRAVGFFDVPRENIIVVHDELDLAFGTVRVKNGGGTAGHKGITSIKNLLGHAEFPRVRMGIGRPEHGSVSDYVLKDFSADETISLHDVVKRGADAVQSIAESGVTAAMNEFNRRNVPAT